MPMRKTLTFGRGLPRRNDGPQSRSSRFQHRPVDLGRETGIGQVVWQDGRRVLVAGAQRLRGEIPREGDPASVTDRSGAGAPPSDFEWLRAPHPDRIFAMTEQGHIVIGRESIGSGFKQALTSLSCPGDWPGGNLALSLAPPPVVGGHGSFTGPFAGMMAFDITGQGRTATCAKFSCSPW